MKQHNLTQLHLACSDDDLRPAMNYIKINGRVATATNGHILIRIVIEDGIRGITNLHLLNDKLISKWVWKEMYDSQMVEAKEDRIVCDKGDYIAEFPIPQPDEEYPNFVPILKDLVNDKYEKVEKISFNAEYIDKIKRASGISYHKHMTLSFRKENRGVLITCSELDGIALLMPVIPDDRHNSNSKIIENFGHFLTEETPVDCEEETE